MARRFGNTGTRRSGGGCDTGRKDKLANNKDKDKDCHGKESWEHISSACTKMHVGRPKAEKEAFWGKLDDVKTLKL